MTQNISMQTIADAIGCSRVAVSRALRNDPKISVATRDRVKQMARELGYRPNPMVSALMASRSSPHGRSGQNRANLVLLSDPSLSPELLKTHPNYQEQLSGVRQRATELGFGLELFSLQETPVSPDRLARIFRTRAYRGVIVLPHKTMKAHLDALAGFLPLSLVGTPSGFEEFSAARTSTFQNITMAFQRLVDLGYRRPALISSWGFENEVGHRYYGGSVAAAKFQPKLAQIKPFIIGLKGRKQSLAGWLEKNRPDVLISAKSGAEFVQSEMGWRFPEDIAFAMIDRKSSDARFGGIDSCLSRQGDAAVDIVSAQAYRNEVGENRNKHDVVVAGRWVDGPSAPPK